jgi:hypothetical protein
MRKWFVFLAPAAALLLLAGCATMGGMDEADSMKKMDDTASMDSSMESMGKSETMAASFTVTIEVLDRSVTPIAPVAWAVFDGANPLFTARTGERIAGLESLAEDGDPSGVVQALAGSMDVSASGVAAVPEGAMDPGPATPGKGYSFEFSAHDGQRLSFATMYVQSNDLFFAPAGEGLELFEMGKPISGDVTSKIYLYDAGTEVNEKPGSGAHQAPRQMGPNSGKDEMAAVRPVSEVSDGFMYPSIGAVIKVTVAAM